MIVLVIGKTSTRQKVSGSDPKSLLLVKVKIKLGSDCELLGDTAADLCLVRLDNIDAG